MANSTLTSDDNGNPSSLRVTMLAACASSIVYVGVGIFVPDARTYILQAVGMLTVPVQAAKVIQKGIEGNNFQG
jgi:hypothetical protein